MTLRAIALLSVVWAAAGVGGATARQQSMPPETAAYQPSALPGYEIVRRSCLTCHSAQYVSTQPPGSTRTYWDATVKKMKKPFGAPFPDEDIGAMVDYLVKTYGAERATTPANRRGAAPRREPSPRSAAAPVAQPRSGHQLRAPTGPPSSTAQPTGRVR